MPDDTTLVYQGKLIALHKERVDFPQGGHTYFDIVKHPGGAVIAAIDDDDQICLVKQWRHALGQFIWELPAGCLEPNESPLATAKRELEEEAGVRADQWQELGLIASSPGFSNEVLYLFVAKKISLGKLKLDDAEQLEAHWLPLSEVRTMIRDGEIIDAKTLALISKIDLL